MQSHRRRKAFGLPAENPWVLWGRGVAIGLVFLAALWIYKASMPVPTFFGSIAFSARAAAC